jgi:hypothetical protein
MPALDLHGGKTPKAYKAADNPWFDLKRLRLGFR